MQNVVLRNISVIQGASKTCFHCELLSAVEYPRGLISLTLGTGFFLLDLNV